MNFLRKCYQYFTRLWVRPRPIPLPEPIPTPISAQLPEPTVSDTDSTELKLPAKAEPRPQFSVPGGDLPSLIPSAVIAERAAMRTGVVLQKDGDVLKVSLHPALLEEAAIKPDKPISLMIENTNEVIVWQSSKPGRASFCSTLKWGRYRGTCVMDKELLKGWRKHLGGITRELTSHDASVEPPAITASFRAMAERCHLDQTSGEIKLVFGEEFLDISLSRGLIKKMELEDSEPLIIAFHRGQGGLVIGRHPTGTHYAQISADGGLLRVPMSEEIKSTRVEQLGMTHIQPAMATDRLIFTPLKNT